MTVLGFNDASIWLVYLLCILSALYGLIYGLVNWNKGDEEVYPEDKKWVEDEKKVEETL